MANRPNYTGEFPMDVNIGNVETESMNKERLDDTSPQKISVSVDSFDKEKWEVNGKIWVYTRRCPCSGALGHLKFAS